MRISYIFSLLLMSIVSLSDAMVRFDHRSAFSCEAMSDTYVDVCSISDDDLIAKFKECSNNNGRFEPAINAAIRDIASNEVGRDTLRFIVARLYKFVKCANSLEALMNAIPEAEQSEASDIIDKAKAVILFCDAFGIRGKGVLWTSLNIDRYLSRLKTDPIEFPPPDAPYRRGSLLEVFDDVHLQKKKEKRAAIINDINEYWNTRVKRVIASFLPILREGMFSLVCGSDTRYAYNKTEHTAEISLSETRSSIRARCITGPLLTDHIDGRRVNVCYELCDKIISADSGLHHEIFHHLTIGLELDPFPSFSRLIPYLIRRNIDRVYIVNLKGIYSDMDEFRNIIGVFVNKKGDAYFDPCSEAAYLSCEGKSIRGTHKSTTRGIKYVPIDFVNFLKDVGIRGFTIDEGVTIQNCSDVKWR